MTVSARQPSPLTYTQLLARYLGPQRFGVILLSILVLASIGLQLILPQIMGQFIDSVQAGGTLEALIRLGLVYLGLALVQLVVSLGAAYLGENVGWGATNALRADIAAHCLQLDLSFHNSHTPGEMIERIDGDITALSNFFSQFVIQIVGNSLLLVGISILLFRVNVWVGLTITIFIVAVLFILGRFRNIAVPHWKAERQASAELFGFLEERLAGTEDIAANGGRAYVMGHFFQLMRELLQRALRAAMMINILLNATLVLFAAGNAAAFAVGTYLFQGEVISLGTVYLIYQYTVMLQRPVEQITRQIQDLQRAGAAAIRSNELLSIQSTLVDRSTNRPAGFVSASDLSGALAVAYDQVTFTYPDAPRLQNGIEVAELEEADKVFQGEQDTHLQDDTPEQVASEAVLCNLSFQLEAGATLGLLGRTGSGKTSLTRLLFRFYDPETGAIRLQPIGTHVWSDLRDVPLGEVRQRIGMIPQHVQLFNASVRDNLTFFDPAVPDEAILLALNELGLKEWLEALPKGLDTELEAGGSGLSAGQAQLLAFARIFLKDPGLVVLDEASSRLDPATEHLIEKAIDRLVQGRTAIIVAHRLSTVLRADQIMILNNGDVMEYGRRATLAADPHSHFYRLLQTGMEDVLA